MPKAPPHHFHVRLPKDLLATLLDGKGDNSLNSEIVSRLERSFSHDLAIRVGDLFHPLLGSLKEGDRDELLKLAEAAVEILSRSRR